MLEQMQADVLAGRFQYKAPWALDSAGGSGDGANANANKTGHSLASSLSAAFLTPGGLEERRSTATPTVVSRSDSAAC